MVPPAPIITPWVYQLLITLGKGRLRGEVAGGEGVVNVLAESLSRLLV